MPGAGLAAYWPSLAGGILIGLASAVLLLLNGRVAGISGIAGNMLRQPDRDTPWRAAFLVGLLAGPMLFTFALGTAAGDLATEALSLGFQVGVLVFGALIAAITAAYYLGANAVLTFWLAYILTRPLGASLGDLLSQSQAYGGLGLGTVKTSIVFLAVIVALVTFLSVGPNRTRSLPKALEDA